MRIIYLHGFASGPSSGKALFFKERFAGCGVEMEIPALDGGDFEHLTITSQLRVVERIARGEAVSLIGSSMGGYLAALYASLHPEASKLVLMAPAFHFPHRWPAELGVEKTNQWRATGWMDVFHYGFGSLRRLHYGIIEDALAYPAEPSFTQPALVFHGTADDVVPHAFSEGFARAHTNVRLRLFASDHQLMDVLEPMWADVEPFLLG